MSQLVGSSVQLHVGYPLTTTVYGHSVGCPPYLLLEQLVNQIAAREFRPCVIKQIQHLLPLTFR